MSGLRLSRAQTSTPAAIASSLRTLSFRSATSILALVAAEVPSGRRSSSALLSSNQPCHPRRAVMLLMLRAMMAEMAMTIWKEESCIVIPLIERGRAAGGFTFFERTPGGNADDRQRGSVAGPNDTEHRG